MKPVKELLNIETIEELASRSNFRYGKEIAEEGEIIFEKSNTFNLIAKVKFRTSQTRTVQLISTPKGLRFKCTCTNKKDDFCQHCVAVATKTQN